MRTIFAEYNPQRNSIDIHTNVGYKIIYRVIASVESDYTAHVIFKVQKRFFECPFTYCSQETPKCCSLQKKSGHSGI